VSGWFRRRPRRRDRCSRSQDGTPSTRAALAVDQDPVGDVQERRQEPFAGPVDEDSPSALDDEEAVVSRVPQIGGRFDLGDELEPDGGAGDRGSVETQPESEEGGRRDGDALDVAHVRSPVDDDHLESLA
jgi:hypothetical protein